MKIFEIITSPIRKIFVEPMIKIFKIIIFIPKATIIGFFAIIACIGLMFIGMFETTMRQVLGTKSRRSSKIFHI